MKAMTQSVLVAILISLAVALAIGLLTYTLISAGQKKGLEEECRFSLTNIHAVIGTPIPSPALNCPYKPKRVEGDELQQIADELGTCWYKTKGKESTISTDFAISDFRTCIVCGEFTVGKALSSNDLIQYLQQTATPAKFAAMGGAGKTYVQFLDTDWGSIWGVLESMPTDKAGNEQLQITPKTYGEGKLQPLPGLYPDDNYFVVKWNSGFYRDEPHFNHLFIVRSKDIPQLDCKFYRKLA